MLSSNSPACCLFPENDITSSSSSLLQYHDLYQLHSLDLTPITPPATIRPAKKDRHSKINTARGPRDRRMRLSLQIARKFFDLQDLLGFDKASRTVEWLLNTSGAAIKDLARASSDHSSTCDQEEPRPSKSRARREKVIKRVVGRRTTVGKESRTKARERARERTSQKRRLNNINAQHLGPSTESLPFAFNHTADPPPPWNPFCYHGQNAAFFNQEDEQIGEFEFDGKAWEDFNSFNLSG